MKRNSSFSPLLMILLVFLGGILTGILIELLIPLFDIANFYQEWGLWGTIGRIGIMIFLFSIPIGYFIWLITGLIGLSRPKELRDIARREQIIPQFPQITRILLPIGDGTNAMLGLQLVSQLTNREKHGLITLFKILPTSQENRAEQEKKHLHFLAHQSLLDYQHDFTIEVKISVSNEVVGPILYQAKEGRYDLLVIGASERSNVGKFMFGSIPHKIAAQAPCPVVIIRRAIPVNPPE